MSQPQSETQPVPLEEEPDPIEQAFQVFLGAAASLFVELGFLLVRPLLEVMLGVVFVIGLLLTARLTSRFWGVGMILGAVVPTILVLAFVPHDKRQDLHHGQIPGSAPVVAPLRVVATASIG